jgi:hypothetical protein
MVQDAPVSLQALVLLAVASGCGGQQTTAPVQDAAVDVTSLDAPAGLDAGPAPPVVDASGCPAIPGSDLPAGSSPASGNVTGTSIDGVLCPAGAFARIESAGAHYDTAPYFFVLGYTVGGSAPVNDFVFTSPPGANHGELDVLLGLPAPAPGQFSSSSAQQCGSMAFTYYLPVPAWVDCDGGTGPSCPPGCSAACAITCGPCEPQEPSVGFTAQGPADCLGNTTPAFGSWTLSLTSVTEASGGGQGLSYYTPHGSFSATMDGGDAGTATFVVGF